MQTIELSTAERLVLAALAAGATRAAEIKKPKATERDAALTSLAAAGLLSTAKQGRAVTVALTDAGRAAAAAIAVAEPAKPARATKAAGVSVAAHEALALRVARLEALVDQWTASLTAKPVLAVEDRVAEAAPLRDVVLDVVARLDERSGRSGLVAIPLLRDELRRDGVRADDRAVDGVLLALERERAVELRIAQSPATLPDRSLGIERPGRGLVYWVSPRSHE